MLKSFTTQRLFIIEVSCVMSVRLTICSLRNDAAEISETGTKEFHNL